jgi:hypothetical protein
MANIQKTLDALQPYVIGIRYFEGTPIVDAIFKEGWSVQEDKGIKKVKGEGDMNYYMLFGESENIGLDELLESVERTIKLNVEKEKKHQLLKLKVEELKVLFKNQPLTKLNRLKFSFSEEDLVPKLEDIDIDLTDAPPQQQINEFKPSNEAIEETNTPIETSVVNYLDENGKPIELSEEDKEMIEEERRAEMNRKKFSEKKKNNLTSKIELPPKNKMRMAMAEIDEMSDCECGPNEACEKCIDNK